MAIQLPLAATVLANDRLGGAARLLRLDTAGTHVPGQVLGLALPPRGPLRWYSISSAPGRDYQEVIYTLVEDGRLTPGLWDLRPGDTVLVQEARGGFRDPEDGAVAKRGTPVWWIANGTGVSPFLSMIRDPGRRNARSLSARKLIFGCRTIEDGYFLDEIGAACSERGLAAVVCLSAGIPSDGFAERFKHQDYRPAPDRADLLSPGLHLHAGRLTDWPGLETIPADQRAMLCGSSAMVNDVRLRLNLRGMPLENIFAEIYF